MPYFMPYRNDYQRNTAEHEVSFSFLRIKNAEKWKPYLTPHKRLLLADTQRVMMWGVCEVSKMTPHTIST